MEISPVNTRPAAKRGPTAPMATAQATPEPDMSMLQTLSEKISAISKRESGHQQQGGNKEGLPDEVKSLFKDLLAANPAVPPEEKVDFGRLNRKFSRRNKGIYKPGPPQISSPQKGDPPPRAQYHISYYQSPVETLPPRSQHQGLFELRSKGQARRSVLGHAPVADHPVFRAQQALTGQQLERAQIYTRNRAPRVSALA